MPHSLKNRTGHIHCKCCCTFGLAPALPVVNAGVRLALDGLGGTP